MDLSYGPEYEAFRDEVRVFAKEFGGRAPRTFGFNDETRAWQQQIPDSELVVLPGNSYHVAATHADPAARATLDFLARRGG